MVISTHTKKSLGGLLYSLMELEYDTQAAFEAAITRLSSQAYKEQLREFLADQQRHIMDLKTVAAPVCDTLPHGADASRLLTRGLLMLAHLAGDRAILQALSGPLGTMNQAYEHALTQDVVTPEVLVVIQRHFLDERRHRDWIVRCLHPELAEAQGQGLPKDAIFFDLNGRPPVSFTAPRHD